MSIYAQFEALAQSHWWESVDSMGVAYDFLDAVSKPEQLAALLDAVTTSQVLSGLSERLRSLDKIVLLDDRATKTRLRLHHFKEGTYDLMHNHKWPFYSKVLKGHLVQELFDSLDATAPQFVSSFATSSSYFLGPGLFHKLRAKQETITLILRGPDLIQSAKWRDVNSGDVWDHVGGKSDDKKVDFDAVGLSGAITNIRSALSHQ